MVVVVKDPERIFYHKENCRSISEYSESELQKISEEEAVKLGYLPCSCMTISPDDPLSILPSMRSMSYEYDEASNIVYVRTSVGFWKIVRNPFLSWALYHRDAFNKSLSMDELKRGHFHLQGDIDNPQELYSLVMYIHRHDAAKRIIKKNYRDLPRTTKR